MTRAQEQEANVIRARAELVQRFAGYLGGTTAVAHLELEQLERRLGMCPAHAFAERVIAAGTPRERLTSELEWYVFELSLRGLASSPVTELVARYDREPLARDAIRRELSRRWNGEAELLELERDDILEDEEVAA